MQKKAKIVGPAKLKGTDVKASDLRAGAALIIAGLVAEGTTKILNRNLKKTFIK